MKQILSSWFVVVIVMALAPGRSSGQDPAPSSAVQDSILRATQLIQEGDENSAIAVLQNVIQATLQDFTRLGDAYIVLAKAYLTKANRYEGDDITVAQYENLAAQKVKECLTTYDLRHTMPTPGNSLYEDWYEELDKLFRRVRSESLGIFHISELTPPEALVILNADTLRGDPEEGIVEGDIPPGKYLLVIQADGYQTRNVDLEISAGTHTRTYRLDKKKGFFWYASRGAVAAAAVVAGGIVASGGDDTPAEPEPLPGPPAPPD